MKTLIEYINEKVQLNEASDKPQSKSITFNFSGLEDAEETLKSFEEKEYCTVEDEKLTVTVTVDNLDKLGDVTSALKQYSSKLMSSTERASHEDYAQKTRKFDDQVKELTNTIAELGQAPEEEKDKQEEE